MESVSSFVDHDVAIRSAERSLCSVGMNVSFESLYRAELRGQVQRAALLLGSATSANDVVHDAFIAVFQRWDSLEDPGPYLNRCALDWISLKSPNIYADGCQWMTADPPVGPTVDDLASAWANVPDVAPTAMQDVVVDGYPGKQIEFTVPDFRAGDCKSDLFALWYSPGDNAPGFWLQGRNANQHTQQRILDVDGTRLVISAYYLPSSLAEDRAALENALASVQIG